MVKSEAEKGFEELNPLAIVLSSPGEFSKVLLASSVFKNLRIKYPDIKIYFLIQDVFSDLFVKHPALSGVIHLSATTTAQNLSEIFKTLEIDTIVHLETSELVSKAALLANIKNGIAFNAKESGDANIIVLPPESHKELNEAFHNFDLLTPFNIDVPKKPMIDLALDESKETSLWNKVKSYAITPNTDFAVFSLDFNFRKHSVAASVYSNAARRLSSKTGMPIIIIGENKKTPEFLSFCRQAHGANLIDLRDKLTPSESAYLLKRARICVSGESAFAYLASAMNCPLVALFVDFSSGKWFPLGPLTTNIFSGAVRFFLEPNFLYNKRASRAFKLQTIISAIDFTLELKHIS